MTTNYHEKFEEIEIEHNFRTFYATGYIDFRDTECIGTNYEGYDFERYFERAIFDITISELWYYDDESGEAVEILGIESYEEFEEVAEEEIRYKYE